MYRKTRAVRDGSRCDEKWDRKRTCAVCCTCFGRYEHDGKPGRRTQPVRPDPQRIQSYRLDNNRRVVNFGPHGQFMFGGAANGQIIISSERRFSSQSGKMIAAKVLLCALVKGPEQRLQTVDFRLQTCGFNQVIWGWHAGADGTPPFYSYWRVGNRRPFGTSKITRGADLPIFYVCYVDV